MVKTTKIKSKVSKLGKKTLGINKEQKINKRFVISFLVVLVLVLVLVNIWSFYRERSLWEKKVFDIKVYVGDTLGFDVNAELLVFGIVPRGAVGKRFIEFKNDSNIRKKIDMSVYGEVAPWVWVSDNHFYLDPDQYRKITVSLKPSQDAEKREYHGKLVILIK